MASSCREFGFGSNRSAEPMTATNISWTQEVWNWLTGCDAVSSGCEFCYAMVMAKRLKAHGHPKYQSDGDPRGRVARGSVWQCTTR